MPRYFFHIVDDQGRCPDEEGSELPNLGAAKKECEASARQLLIEDIKTYQEVDNRCIEVANSYGDVLEVCRLRDLVN
jgi:hypothetical protein